jgi:hypothetical protein
MTVRLDEALGLILHQFMPVYGYLQSVPHSAAPGIELHEIWFQLSLSDRQRFGHCFSAMVLKALGLRACSTEEDET